TIFPGSYRIATEEGIPLLALSGPTYPISFCDAFRVSQRVPARQGTYTVSLEARAAEDVQLHLEICEKHLLYNQGCAISWVKLKGSSTRWEPVTIVLDGRELTGGRWYAPRLAFFSMSLETSGKVIQ